MCWAAVAPTGVTPARARIVPPVRTLPCDGGGGSGRSTPFRHTTPGGQSHDGTHHLRLRATAALPHPRRRERR